MYTPEIYVPICIVLVHEHIAEILSKRVSDVESYFVGFRSKYFNKFCVTDGAVYR